MSETQNECEIVNRLSRKVEKELADNMTEVNEDIARIDEVIENMAVIDDTTASDSTTYSSEKIEGLIDDIPTGAEIDDTVTSTTKTWSSSKIEEEIDAGGGGSDVIDDTNVATTTTFSSSKIVDLLYSVLSGQSKYVAINTSISRITENYTTVLTITNLNLSSTSKGVLNLNYSVTAGSGHPEKELLITGIKLDNTSYTISDTIIERSETATQEYTLNIPSIQFEDNTTQIKIEIKNTTNDQYSATFNFTGYLNTLAF